MKKSYKKYIWHDPNCRAWHRNPRNNKPYPHLVKKFGNVYNCTCGYDEDYEKILAFKKGRNYHDKKLPFYRGQLVYIKPIKDSALDSDCLAIVCETSRNRYSVLVLDKNGKYRGPNLQAWVEHKFLAFKKNPTRQYLEWLEMAEDSDEDGDYEGFDEDELDEI